MGGKGTSLAKVGGVDVGVTADDGAQVTGEVVPGFVVSESVAAVLTTDRVGAG